MTHFIDMARQCIGHKTKLGDALKKKQKKRAKFINKGGNNNNNNNVNKQPVMALN